jgi:purine-binding chemotaxis protein CheW
MYRKKKLESSLDGLFSKSKNTPEPTGVEKKAETQLPVVPDKPKNPAPAAVKKSTLRKKAEKTKETPKATTAEPAAPAPAAYPETVVKKSETQPAAKPVEVVKEPVKAELKPEPTPEVKETPAASEPKGIQPVKKAEMSLSGLVDNDLAVVEVDASDIQLLVFEINQVQYAIDVSMVQTIIKPQSVFLVPGTAEYLKGLINLRGEVVPVIDLRTRFDLPTQDVSKDTRFVVVKVNEYMASMVVDRVHGVETIPLNVIEKPSGLVIDIDNRYMTGMARYEERIILILDLLQTIRPQKIEQR